MKHHSSNHAGWWIIGGFMGLVVLFLVLAIRSSAPPDSAKKTTREIALLCTTDMATQFHIHPFLKIIANGQKQEIPLNIGIFPTCMNSIHTHDASGKLHVESPEKRDFTLADFFAVWGKPFTKDQILDYKVDATHRIRETLNGKEVQDFENTVLRDGDRIIIYYEAKQVSYENYNYHQRHSLLNKKVFYGFY